MNNYVEQNMCLWQLMFKHTPEFTHTAHGVLLRWKCRKVRIVYGVIIKFTVLLLVASILMDVSCLSAPGKSELPTVFTCQPIHIAIHVKDVLPTSSLGCAASYYHNTVHPQVDYLHNIIFGGP